MLRSNAEQLVRKTLAGFVDNEVIPKAQEIDEKGEFPMEIFQAMARMGVFGIGYPKDEGGPAETPRSTASSAKNSPEA